MGAICPNCEEEIVMATPEVMTREEFVTICPHCGIKLIIVGGTMRDFTGYYRELLDNRDNVPIPQKLTDHWGM